MKVWALTMIALLPLLEATLAARADTTIPDTAWYKARVEEVSQAQAKVLRLPYECHEDVKDRVFDSLEIACVDRKVTELAARLAVANSRYPILQKSLNELKNCATRDRFNAPTGYYGYRCVSEKATAAYNRMGETLDDIYTRARLTELDQTLKDPSKKPHAGKTASQSRKKQRDDVPLSGGEAGPTAQAAGAQTP